MKVIFYKLNIEAGSISNYAALWQLLNPVEMAIWSEVKHFPLSSWRKLKNLIWVFSFRQENKRPFLHD